MSQIKPRVFIVGVGMTPFTKPSKTGLDYPELVGIAVTDALKDAGIEYKQVEQATASYIYGDTCCGQRALYQFGFTGIPIFNVNNACASGSSGLFLCKQIIESGNADVTLAVGFEKMETGSLPIDLTRTHSLDKHLNVVATTFGIQPGPVTPQFFVNAALEHMKKYGTKREHFAKIAYKNHLHSVNNPKSQFQTKYTLEEVTNARKIQNFLGLLECSPTSDGAAAAIIVSEKFLAKNPRLWSQAVEIVGMELGTDHPSPFAENTNLKMVGFDMMKTIADRLYQKTGLSAHDAQVIELHDCFAPNELISYESLGLCPIGKGGDIVDRNDNTYGGKWVINPSGGLISKGHPIGATGIAQAVELSNQLRGICGLRQVPNCKLALQHNIGLGGAGVVAFYRLATNGVNLCKIAATPPKIAMKSDVIFEEIRQRAETDVDVGREINAVFGFEISDGKNTKHWTVDLIQYPPLVVENSTGKVDTHFTLSEENFLKIASGELKADQAFMQGKMKVKGDISKAIKLKSVLDPSKLKSRL